MSAIFRCRPSVLDAVRREVQRVSEILARLGEMVEEDTYETIDYAGPAQMIDLRQAGDASRGADPRLRGTRVLVADDDMGIRESLKELLEAWGCRVQTAGGRCAGPGDPRPG